MQAKAKMRGAGYGASSKGVIGPRAVAAGLPYSINMGKGLSENCDPFREAYVFGSELNIPNAENWNCPAEIVNPTNTFDISTINAYKEVVVAILYLSNLPSGSTYNVNFNWYRDRDNKLLYTFQHTIPDAADYGYTGWDWVYIYCYIGYVPWEIWEDGDYHVDITVSGGGEVSDSINFIITGLRRELTEERVYPVKLTVTNQSTDAGVPVGAELGISILAKTVEQAVLIPLTASKENFLPDEIKEFLHPLYVPPATGGQAGTILSFIYSPRDDSIASDTMDVIIRTKVLPGPLQFYDGTWHAFHPTEPNIVEANRDDTWVYVELFGTVPGKLYRIGVVTPRGTFTFSIVATYGNREFIVQTPTGPPGTEIWTIRFYDEYEGYMFWQYDFNMNITTL